MGRVTNRKVTATLSFLYALSYFSPCPDQGNSAHKKQLNKWISIGICRYSTNLNQNEQAIAKGIIPYFHMVVPKLPSTRNGHDPVLVDLGYAASRKASCVKSS